MSFKLEDFKDDALACPRCSNCKWVDHVYIKSHRFAKICPISAKHTFNAYSAHGILDIALALLNNQLDYTPKLLEIAYKCTLCGACDVRCKRNLDIEVLLVIEALRARCVEDGNGPMLAHRRIAQKIESTGNRYGAPRQNRRKWLPEDTRERKADLIYFAGCSAAYKHPEIAKATIKILNKSQSQFMVMEPEEWCCGNPLYSTGQMDAAKRVMQHNIAAIERSGANTVITSCAECYKTLKVDYAKMLDKSTEAMGFKVLHIVEYAEELLKRGSLRFNSPVKMKVTYHDPCQLGRLSEPWVPWHGERKKFGILEPPKNWRRGTHGVYQPPRELLKKIPEMTVVEMERMKENAWCCGAGGGTRDAYKDFALWTAGERLEEAKSAGAEAIISGCPFCKDNLREAARVKGDKITAYDITEVIAQALAE